MGGLESTKEADCFSLGETSASLLPGGGAHLSCVQDFMKHRRTGMVVKVAQQQRRRAKKRRDRGGKACDVNR
jgi:hypothetical protein